MSAPSTGGSPPPRNDAAPASASASTRATATNHSAAQLTECSRCSVAERHRRRAASRRLSILDSGHGDPWRHDEVPMTDHQRECWQRTVAHLTAAGFRAIIPTDILVGLR